MNLDDNNKFNTRGINADVVETPILICDINDNIIYKNSSAYTVLMPRKNACVLTFLTESDKMRYLSVKNGESVCESVNFLSKKSSNLGYVCRYRQFSLETFWIFPRSVGGFTDGKQAEKFKKFISELAQRIEYGYENCKKPRRVLTGVELLRKNLLSCLTKVMPFSRSFFMKPNDARTVIMKFLSDDLLPEGYTVSGAEILSDESGVVFDNSDVLISSFLNMLTIFISRNPSNVNISVKHIDDRIYFEALFMTDALLDCQYDNISELNEKFPEQSAEISILQYLCDQFEWNPHLVPHYFSSYNAMLSLSAKAINRSLVRSCECENSDISAYWRFVDLLNSDDAQGVV